MADADLFSVRGEFSLCRACLDGAGGECHSPGCVLWLYLRADGRVEVTAEEDRP